MNMRPSPARTTKTKEPASLRALPIDYRLSTSSEVHVVAEATAAVVVAVVVTAARFFLLGLVGDHRLGGEQQRRNGRGVLERGAGHLGRVDDAGLGEVFELLAARVEAERLVLR